MYHPEIPKPIHDILEIPVHLGRFALHHIKDGGWGGDELQESFSKASITYYSTKPHKVTILHPPE